MLNDFRKDYILNRWVVIATERQRRPVDFIRETATKQSVEEDSCPFCPGNEDKTPPATLVYLQRKEDLVKEKDTDGRRHRDWLIRCVPNMYPAFSAPRKDDPWEGKAVGYHEVLIESPNHSEHPAESRIPQLTHVINGYIDRLKALSESPFVKYVSIFRNHGSEAGASLSHAHSQIIATPIVPTVLAEELSSSRDYHQKHGKCVFCEIIRKESKGPRMIWENTEYLTFTPWAAIHPFEFWVIPKIHQTTLQNLNQNGVKSLATALKTCLRALRRLLKDPPYNFAFHIAPQGARNDPYHWHLEVYPKLAIWAGFEKSTGVFINTISPERAASQMKEIIE
ncbi:MAG: galactose-1-phosphate uridylyltransferase [Candidatus Bathyarchaeota archaeon]|nr:MAG: galactose-1-phosphate uridylyltransferase [Candidatus Bathyarchaeota archaeon]